jgi:hypothetical protein
MNQFVNNLKRAAIENPLVTIGVAVSAVAVTAKLIEAVGNNAGSRAYAKDVNRRVKNSK